MIDQVVFSTPWFEIVEKHPAAGGAPHYALTTKDYVSVVALTRDGRMPLVRQFRPAIGRTTLELPSGHVEDGETPEEAARKELLEETGLVADDWSCLGDLSPDTGRLANRMWCFFAGGARPTDDPSYRPEAGIEPVLFDGAPSDLISEPGFDSALNSAVLFLAVSRGFLPIRRG
jgi:ADP-ribose pyrophosphatase